MKMRLCLLILLICVIAIPASADRIILAPTGTTLMKGHLRAEAAVRSSGETSEVYWLGVGLQNVELNAVKLGSQANVAGAAGETVIGAELAVLPETIITPGVGVGVWDAAGQTERGRGYYLAISKALPAANLIPGPLSNIRVHTGFGVSGINGVFLGAEANGPIGLTFSAEYFLKDFNYAVGWRALPGLQLKMSVLDGDKYYGLSFNPKF